MAGCVKYISALSRLASSALQSECGVHMNEVHISVVMKTKPLIQSGLDESQIVELWLSRQRSPLTRSVYRRDLQKLTLLDKTLAEVDPIDLERFAERLASSGLAPISQGRTLAAVRSFFRFAERIGYCRNVACGLQLPRTDSALSERIISEEDVRRLIDLEADVRNKVLIALIYAAGLRVSEACGLRWRNLQARGDAGQILIYGKGGHTRVVLLPTGVWGQLVALKATARPEAPVFASRSGKALDRSRVLRIVRQASQRAGIEAKVTTHWLRHAHASHFLDRGAPIHLVQATLGHRSVATTSRYLHARPGESSAKYVSS
jgi:site-specific recombinase XerD